MARAGEKADPPTPAPNPLKRYLSFARLPDPALEVARRALELYEVDDAGLAEMDRLERIGAPDGYRRCTIAVSLDGEEGQARGAQVYLKDPALVSAKEIKAGPLAEYTAEHAKTYRKRSA